MARLAGALLLFVLFFGSLLGRERVLAQRDTLRFYLPIAKFWCDEVKQGRFPAWWPYDGLGSSLVGSGVGAVLWPLQLLGLVLGPDQGVKWEVLIGFVIAAVGAARLTRALGADEPGQWLAAVSFAGCGFMLSETDNLIYQQTPALLPWTALAAFRLAHAPTWPRTMLLALAIALAFWAGDVQGTLFQSALAALMVLAIRGVKGLPWLAATGAVCSAWCAPLLPAMRAVGLESGRKQFGYDLPTAEIWSLHPLRIFELFFGPPYPLPDYWTHPAELGRAVGAPDWGVLFSASVAVGTVALAGTLVLLLTRGITRAHTVLASFGAVTLWLALGRFAGLYGLFFRFVPMWSAFRYPQKLVVFPSFVLAVLGGVGLRRLAEPGRTRWIVVATLAAAGAGLMAAGRPEVVGPIFLPTSLPSHSDLVESVVLAVTARGAAAVLMLGTVAAAMAWRPRWAPATAAVVGICQVAWLAADVIQPGSRSLIEHRPALADRLLAATTGPVRLTNGTSTFRDPQLVGATDEIGMLHVEIETLSSDHGSRFGIGNLLSYSPAKSGALSATCGLSPQCGSPCARRLAAEWCIIPEGDPVNRHDPELVVQATIDSPRAALVRDRLARPLVSVPGVLFVPTIEELRRRVSADPSTRAMALGGAEELPSEARAASFVRPAPGQIDITVTLQRPNLVVIAELASAGWRALLDGKEVTIHRVDLGLMGVESPAGTHHLTLRYVPPGWPWAWAPYVMAWIAAAVTLGVRLTKGTC